VAWWIVIDVERPFGLGDWSVSPGEGTVSLGTTTVRLEPRVMALLVRLASEPGTVVSREKLLRAVWGETTVEEGALSRCVFEIRRALGDQANDPRYVETIPKRGYKVVAAVKQVLPDDVDAGAATPSIAVLPFLDLSPGQDQAYFTDGIAEELIHALAQVRGLHVAARTSSFQFRGPGADFRKVGASLGVAAVVEGSVRRESSRLRIAVQLIDVQSGFHLWSERYDRDLEGVFRIQEDIARAVVDRTRPELLADHRVPVVSWRGNVEALDLCLEAAQYLQRDTPEGLRIAKSRYQKAMETDPGCAPAWTGLSGVLAAEVILGVATREQMAAAQRAAEHAIELGEPQGRALVALATAELFQWNWRAALDACLSARDLSPGSAFVHFTSRYVWQAVGRLEEALHHAEAACRLNPISASYQRGLGTVLVLLERWQEGAKCLERAMEINPDSAYCAITLAAAKWHLGERRDSLALLAPRAGYREDLPSSESEHGEALRKVLDCWMAEDLDGHWFFAAVFYSFLDEEDRTLQALRSAVANREPTLINLQAWPTFGLLRDSLGLAGEFQKLLVELKLDPPESY